MLQYPEINPVALNIGVLQIHWYGLSYLLGICLVWANISLRARKDKPQWDSESISDIVFYAVAGVLLGGRLGYIFFYNYDQFLSEPLIIFKIWQGGMSFHGGLLGVLFAIAIYAFKKKIQYFRITDLIAPSIPIALCCGRLGNFINTELPGRVSSVPWAVIFPGDTLGRHPSSLYQAILEGPILFFLLWSFTRKHRPIMSISAFFLISYGALRTFSELFRAPDTHIGFLFVGTTMGQLLSIPMILLGLLLMWISYREKRS